MLPPTALFMVDSFPLNFSILNHQTFSNTELTLKPMTLFNYCQIWVLNLPNFLFLYYNCLNLQSQLQKIGKWPQFCIVSASFTIQFGKLKSSKDGNLLNWKCFSIQLFSWNRIIKLIKSIFDDFKTQLSELHFQMLTLN